MLIRPFFIPGIAHSSYIVTGNQTCVVIDPSRDTGWYLRAARGMGVTITHIFETHLHADFISGHLDLAEATGARIIAPRSAGCAFPHQPVGDGDEIAVEDIRFRVIETPGHTPEHICYVATDLSRGETPVALFSGDTLFVGDVGRPDLFPGRAAELASRLFDNLHAKILTLPDECEVYPAHGMGSLCGRAMAAKRSSTIGYERKYNSPLRIQDREDFVRALTTGMPAAPDHFSRCSAINRDGPVLVRALPDPVPLEPAAFYQRIRDGGAVILDTRGYPAFAGLHIPGSWNSDLAGNFATHAAWVLPPGHAILLVAETDGEAHEAARQLRRVGLDQAAGYLDGGMIAWAASGLPTRTIPVLNARETEDLVKSGNAILLDVRSEEEWREAHAVRSIHIPWHDLRSRYPELDPARQYILMCKAGPRASIAAAILAMNGFGGVALLAGGYEAYRIGGFAP